MARRSVAAAAQRVADLGGISEVAHARPGRIEGARLLDVEVGDGRRMAADQFVFACGPWLPTLFPEVAGDLIAVTKQDVVFVGPRAGDTRFGAAALPCWIDYDASYYGVPAVDGRGFKIAPDRYGEPFDPSSDDRVPDPDSILLARRYLARRFPDLADGPILETRTCQYETTPDTNFVIDRHPAFDNVWLVGGGSGHGFKHGPVIGSYVTRLLDGHVPSGEETRFRLDRLAHPGRHRCGRQARHRRGVRLKGTNPVFAPGERNWPRRRCRPPKSPGLVATSEQPRSGMGQTPRTRGLHGGFRSPLANASARRGPRVERQPSVRHLDREEIAGNRIALDVDAAALDRTRAVARGPIGGHGLIDNLGEVDAEHVVGRLAQRRRRIRHRERGGPRHQPDLEALNGPAGQLEPGDLPPAMGQPPRAFETGVDLRASKARLVERLLRGPDGHGEQRRGRLGRRRRRCHLRGGQSDAGDDHQHDNGGKERQSGPEAYRRVRRPEAVESDPAGRVPCRGPRARSRTPRFRRGSNRDGRPNFPIDDVHARECISTVSAAGQVAGVAIAELTCVEPGVEDSPVRRQSLIVPTPAMHPAAFVAPATRLP